jgi:ATP-dependent Lon protease
MRMLKLPDGRIRILVQGLSRARIDYFIQTAPFFKAKITRIEEPVTKDRPLEVEALIRSVKQNLDRAVSLGKNISPEVMVIAANLDDPARLTDLAASNLDLKLEEAQSILETIDPIERLKRVNEMLTREINLLTMQQEISTAAQGEMNKSQREYFLRQQLKAIQSELGEGEELAEEVENYRKKIEEKQIPQEAREEVEKQIKRLERSHPDSAETSIIRTYLDWMTGLPWGVHSQDNHDLARAREILDEDHYDLEKIKERILEYLAVRKLKGTKMKGPNSFVSRSAACATRQRFAAIAEPTSARCPVASFRVSTRPRPGIRYSCWTKSTRSAPITAAIRPQPCWKSSTPNRTFRSAITTSACRTTCRTSCSSSRRTSSTRFNRRSSIAWRSFASPVTRTRRS